MIIDEAIKVLSEQTYDSTSAYDQKLKEAVSLGIEALKSLSEDRFDRFGERRPLLPGETED